MLKVMTNTALAAVTVVVCLALTEVGLRLALPPVEKYHALLPGQERVFNPSPQFLPGVEGVARYQVNQDGIRGRPFGEDGTEYRILAIGGSTTECAYLDESEAWPFVLENELGRTEDGRAVWVGNVGLSGASSRSNYLHLKHLLPQFPPVDAVVLLVGINDVTAALRMGDEYRRPTPITDSLAEREQVRHAFVFAPGKIHEPATAYLAAQNAPWIKTTAIFQLLKRAKLGLTVRRSPLLQDEQGAQYERWREKRARASELIENPPPLGEPLAEFRSNLKAIVDVAEGYGVDLVLITQPTLFRPTLSSEERKLLWLGGIGDFQAAEPPGSYYSVEALQNVVTLFNEALLDLCLERSLECLDMASLLPKDTTVFYDGAHFTEAGSVLFATRLAEFLRQKAAFSR